MLQTVHHNAINNN